jgi:hypothetical protein
MKRLRFFTLIFFTLSGLGLHANTNEEKHKVDFSLDLYTKHLWRGNINGTSLSIQPSVEYINRNFSAGAWAATSIDGSYHELDLFASFKSGNFKTTLYDYYCPVKPLHDNEYFEIEQGKTKHTFDLNIEYSDRYKHPFALLAATMIYGDDLNPDNGRNYYSTYIEPSCYLDLGKTGIHAFTGFTPFKSYYAGSAAIVNMGIAVNRKFRITKTYDIGAILKFAFNPEIKQSWLSIGIKL